MHANTFTCIGDTGLRGPIGQAGEPGAKGAKGNEGSYANTRSFIFQTAVAKIWRMVYSRVATNNSFSIRIIGCLNE